MGLREIDLTPLREAFLARGERSVDVARRLGWEDVRGRADGQRVLRSLGVNPCYYSIPRGRNKGEKRRGYRRTTSYENAVRMARAIGVDPVEVGL